MFLARLRVVFILAALEFMPGWMHAQGPTPQNVQPGMETAVKWKWWVQSTDEMDWGLAANEPASPPEPAAKSDPSLENKAAPPQKEFSIAPGDYEVKRGDALAIISRRSGIPDLNQDGIRAS